MTTTAEFIAEFEGYAGRAYWDVNAWRLGYGSDTEGPDQTAVTEGMSTTKTRALQNLALRIPEFQTEAVYGKTGMGAGIWKNLTAHQKSAITSLVYNYGRLPIVVTASDPEKTAAAIRGLQNANGGVNRKRRLAEAAFYLTPDAAPLPQPAPAPAPEPRPSPPAPQVPIPMPPLPPALPGLPPMLPTTAGRMAALADLLHHEREARIAELVAQDPEIAMYDAQLSAIDKFSPPPSLPPPPTAEPAATTPQGTHNMPTIAINWKTTLSGIITAAGALASAYPQFNPYAQIITSIGALLLGSSSKDANVTGGTKSNVTGAVSAPVSLIRG